MPSIRKGDGTSLTPKGFSEVRKGDGTVLWSDGGDDLPDSEADQKLVHRWYLSEDSDPLVDQIGSADGTNNGTTQVTGDWVDGAAREGDGTEAYIETTTLGTYGSDMANDFAVAFSVDTTDDGVILGINNDTTTLYADLGGLSGTSGEINFFIRDDSGNILWVSTDNTFDDGAPHRVVLNKTGNTASNLEIWVDGSQQPVTVEDDQNFSSPADFQHPLTFCAYNSNGSLERYSAAIADDICFFDDSLTDSEAGSYDSPWGGSAQTFEFESELTDVGGHQGVASDGTYLYTSTSNDDEGHALNKLEKDGTIVESRSDPELDGTDMTQVSDLHIYDGKIWGSSNNYSGDRDDGYVKVWDTSDLSYIEEHQVAGDIAESVGRYDGDWWVVYNDVERVDRYDDTWTKVDDYTLSYNVGGTYGYQSLEWVGDYIYCNLHRGTGMEDYCDVYYWTGSGFDEEARLERPTEDSTQGIATEPGENVMWWAERNTGSSAHDVVKSAFNQTNGQPDGL